MRRSEARLRRYPTSRLHCRLRLFPILVSEHLGQRHHERRVAVEGGGAVRGRDRELLQGPLAGLRLSLGDGLLEVLAHLLGDVGTPFGLDVVGGQAGVPHVHPFHFGERLDGTAVGANHFLNDRRPGRLVELPVPTSDREAGDQTLEVELEGAGQRLVKVVDVEDESAVRRGIAAEVHQMRVTTDLNGHVGVRRVRQVAGHHRGGAPVESELAGEHARVPDRDKFLHPVVALVHQQLHRVPAVSGGIPMRQRVPGDGLANLAADLASFLPAF